MTKSVVRGAPENEIYEEEIIKMIKPSSEDEIEHLKTKENWFKITD